MSEGTGGKEEVSGLRNGRHRCHLLRWQSLRGNRVRRDGGIKEFWWM